MQHSKSLMHRKIQLLSAEDVPIKYFRLFNEKDVKYMDECNDVGQRIQLIALILSPFILLPLLSENCA